MIRNSLCQLPFTAMLLLMISGSNAQYIVIRQGSSPQIDGLISPLEWSDADSILIPLNATLDVTVKFKHDGSSFYFAFLNNLESFNVRFPEILFDINNDKSAAWQNDDSWFHVSATDCDSDSSANDYSDCLAVQSDWTAVPNFAAGLPYTDSVEIEIPFSKAGFNSISTDTIGLSFDVTNTFSAWNFWPDNTVNPGVPASWGFAIVEFTLNSVSGKPKTHDRLMLSPNPFRESLMLTGGAAQGESMHIRLVDPCGREIYREYVDQAMDQWQLNLPDMAAGLYFLEVSTATMKETVRVIKSE
jgi:hypothetical protein